MGFLFDFFKGITLLRANKTVMAKELEMKENVDKVANNEIDSIQQYFGEMDTGNV